MSYLPWAIVALVGYTLVPVLLRIATTGPDAVPSDVAVIISNTVLLFVATTVVIGTDQQVTTHLSSPKLWYVIAGGLCLAVGILAY